MFAGNGDFLQIVLHARSVVHVRFRQRGETQNRVHRRSDVVAHAVQKRGLGAAGLFRLDQRGAQLLPAPLQLVVEAANLLHLQVHIRVINARDFHVRHINAQQKPHDGKEHGVASIDDINGISRLKMRDDRQINDLHRRNDARQFHRVEREKHRRGGDKHQIERRALLHAVRIDGGGDARPQIDRQKQISRDVNHLAADAHKMVDQRQRAKQHDGQRKRNLVHPRDIPEGDAQPRQINQHAERGNHHQALSVHFVDLP